MTDRYGVLHVGASETKPETWAVVNYKGKAGVDWMLAQSTQEGHAKTIADALNKADENDTLRALLAASDKPCAYCGLPAADIAKCASGFPGCGRMDDIQHEIIQKVGEQNDGALLAALNESAELRAENERLRNAAANLLRTIDNVAWRDEARFRLSDAVTAVEKLRALAIGGEGE